MHGLGKWLFLGLITAAGLDHCTHFSLEITYFPEGLIHCYGQWNGTSNLYILYNFCTKEEIVKNLGECGFTKVVKLIL